LSRADDFALFCPSIDGMRPANKKLGNTSTIKLLSESMSEACVATAGADVVFEPFGTFTCCTFKMTRSASGNVSMPGTLEACLFNISTKSSLLPSQSVRNLSAMPFVSQKIVAVTDKPFENSISTELTGTYVFKAIPSCIFCLSLSNCPLTFAILSKCRPAY